MTRVYHESLDRAMGNYAVSGTSLIPVRGGAISAQAMPAQAEAPVAVTSCQVQTCFGVTCSYLSRYGTWQ
jgi:hypothetical protein